LGRRLLFQTAIVMYFKVKNSKNREVYVYVQTRVEGVTT